MHLTRHCRAFPTKLVAPIAAVSALLLSTSSFTSSSTTNCASSTSSDVALSMKERNKRYHSIKLNGQTVLITGATSGIGEACAWRFANEGCKLVLIGRRKDRLMKLKSELTAEYHDSIVHIEALSVSDMEAVASLPQRLPQEFQEIDILVNNAGLALGLAPADQNSIQDAQTTLDTNVLGIIAMCRAFLPGMRARGNGHVINMGSIAG